MAGRRMPPDTRGMTSLKVDGISSRTVVADMEALFEKYGRVGDIYIPRDKNNGVNRGFAFIRFLHKDDAEDAIDSLDGRTYDGRELRVQMAKYDRTERDRDMGRDRGRSRSRSRSRGRRRERSRSRSRSRGRRSRSKERRSRSRSRGSKSSRDSRSRSRGKRSRSRS